ncbi:MAG: ABC transporter permease [Chloroflexi bacterium]|nr:ABC transporter permease [Chloroflexota bacterium]
MAKYVFRRILYMIPMMFIISLLAFIVIQLPPGDYVSKMIEEMRNLQGTNWTPQFEEAMRERYGLNEPVLVQYGKWIGNIVLHGDFGYSFQNNAPSQQIIWDRLGLTVAIALASFLFSWVVALPIGIYSAVRQYSIGDYIFSVLGFIGMAIPGFLIALVVMYVAFARWNVSISGLFSAEYANAPWSLGKFVDLLKHIWLPMIIVGTGGTAGLIRIMRANLLDELDKPYVDTARAKGMPEWRLLLKYPVRHALNPFISTLGWTLPALVAGEAIVSIVLNLPTTGPVYLMALRVQDMHVAAGFLLLLSFLTLSGTLLSDILLAWLDPRIRYE